jgi:ATP dependent DNA ligase-like protein
LERPEDGTVGLCERGESEPNPEELSIRPVPLRHRGPAWVEGGNDREPGLTAWQEVVEHGYEGLVAKDPQSPYVGGRTLKWLKVKQRDYRVEERGWDSRNKS